MEILSAQVASVTLKVIEDSKTLGVALRVRGILTRETADALGCGTALYAGDEPRPFDGSWNLGRGTFCVSYNLTLSPHGMAKNGLRLAGEQVDSFVIERDGDTLVVACKCHVQGALFDILEYLNVIGSGPALCQIEPLQTNLIEVAEHKRPDLVAPTAAPGGMRGIPSDPTCPEWRTSDEIRDGVPRFIVKEKVN